MDVSAEKISLEAVGTRAVIPLARARDAGESLLLAINAATPDLLAGIAKGNTELSPLAVLLGRLTSVAAEETPAAAAPLSEMPVLPKDMAQGLQKSFAQSGLFYESHLALWADGKHSIENLRLEPQARQAADAPAPEGKPVAVPGSPVAESLEPLVRRQLDLIENPVLVWRGDVWPGQSASLEMRPEQNNAGDRPADQPPWTARLRLSLPQLGGIDATVCLQHKDVTLTLNTKDAGAARTIQQKRSDLMDALAAQGVRIANFSVSSNAAG